MSVGRPRPIRDQVLIHPRYLTSNPGSVIWDDVRVYVLCCKGVFVFACNGDLHSLSIG